MKLLAEITSRTDELVTAAKRGGTDAASVEVSLILRLIAETMAAAKSPSRHSL
jgi:hypothetical protein